MKAKLELEMPEDCFKCPCYYWEGFTCQAVPMEIDDSVIEKKHRPDWCPLQIVEEKTDPCKTCPGEGYDCVSCEHGYEEDQ